MACMGGRNLLKVQVGEFDGNSGLVLIAPRPDPAAIREGQDVGSTGGELPDGGGMLVVLCLGGEGEFLQPMRRAKGSLPVHDTGSVEGAL